MIIKILHVADLHLGRMNFGIRDRLMDFAAAAFRVWDIAQAEGVQLVIFSGDVFDSGTPDPYSVWAFRKLCQDLSDHGIQIVAVEGNHDAHPLSMVSGRKCSWVRALCQHAKGEEPEVDGHAHVHRLVFPGCTPTQALRLVAFDWMPSARCQAALDSLPQDVDVLVMHQSCSGFLPRIMTTELQLEQLRGKAKYVAMGDLHVHKSMMPSADTIVAYPGSTEMNKSDEASTKFVNIVEFDLNSHQVVDVKSIQVSDGNIQCLTVRTSDDVLDLRSRLLSGDIAAQMVVIKYETEVAKEIREVVKDASLDSRCVVKYFHCESLPKIIATDVFSTSSEAADVEMSDILTQVLPAGSPELAAAIDLWNNPDNAEQILKELETPTPTPNNDNPGITCDSGSPQPDGDRGPEQSQSPGGEAESR